MRYRGPYSAMVLVSATGKQQAGMPQPIWEVRRTCKALVKVVMAQRHMQMGKPQFLLHSAPAVHHSILEGVTAVGAIPPLKGGPVPSKSTRHVCQASAKNACCSICCFEAMPQLQPGLLCLLCQTHDPDVVGAQV